MPDVGLTTSTEPLPDDTRVIIKFSVEVEGLPVYQESYDVEKLAQEFRQDRELFASLWLRRAEAVVHSRHQRAFSASLTRYIAEGPDASGG